MIASVVSNHCPLLLDCSPMSAAHKRFHFKDYWLRVDGFHGTVATAWGLVHDPDPFRRLVLRLQATARRLTSLVEVLTLMVLTLLVCQGPIAAPRPQAGQPSQPQPECVHCRPKSACQLCPRQTMSQAAAPTSRKKLSMIASIIIFPMWFQ